MIIRGPFVVILCKQSVALRTCLFFFNFLIQFFYNFEALYGPTHFNFYLFTF